MRLISCKVGTIPSGIYLFRAYKLKLGQKIKFRIDGKHDWEIGYVERESPLMIGYHDWMVK